MGSFEKVLVGIIAALIILLVLLLVFTITVPGLVGGELLVLYSYQSCAPIEPGSEMVFCSAPYPGVHASISQVPVRLAYERLGVCWDGECLMLIK
jgi:hypothetical protein